MEVLELVVCHKTARFCCHSLTHITCDVYSLLISLFTFPIHAFTYSFNLSLSHFAASAKYIKPKRSAPLQAIEFSPHFEWAWRGVWEEGPRKWVNLQLKLNENVLSGAIINSFPKWHLDMPFCFAFIDFHFRVFAFWLLFSFSHLLQVKYWDFFFFRVALKSM